MNTTGIIIGLAGAIAAYIMYLLKANSELKRSNAETETKAATIEAVTKAEVQENVAKKSEEDYKSIRDKYMSEHPDGSSN